MSSLMHSPLPAAFEHYTPVAGAYDELLGANGAARHHWQRLVDLLGQWDASELSRRWDQARKLIHDNGVTYNIHDESGGTQRPWVLDPIPLVIAAADWANLEVGINQRARVLDALLADLYGPQHVLREGVVPPELVFANPGFLRCCQGLNMPGGRWLHLYAAVVCRNADGQWVVLGDRTAVPLGLGYALENRLVVSRLLPEVFQESHVERLAPFFLSMRAMLKGLAGNREQPRIAVHSPGPLSENYFLDAYLSRYLGLPLVEGGDLAVRDDRVFIKTLGGLLPVDVLLRRVPDRECDPLELDSAALAGTPGLVHAVRQGRVSLANALGVGFIESPAFSEFLPAVSKRLLGEDLILAMPNSWWCGRQENLTHVLATLDDLVIEPVWPRGVAIPGGTAVKRIVPASLTAEQKLDLVSRIKARPADWVGRAVVAPSVAPSWNGSTMLPAAVTLRCFATATPEGYGTLRGALARFSSSETTGVSLMSGQGSKDVWVLSRGPVAPVTLLPAPGQQLPLRRGGNELPSRVADHLFWLGRNVERAEGAARLLRAVAIRLASESTLETATEVALLLASMSEAAAVRPEWRIAGRIETHWEMLGEVQSLVFDAARSASVAASLRAMWRMASVVRDRISVDSWKILSRTRRDGFLEPFLPMPGGVPMLTSATDDVQSLLDSLIYDLSAFAGLGNESMTRGPGWQFLDMGRRVERATNAIALQRATLTQSMPDSARLFEMLLEIADSSMTYRNRYLGSLQAAPVLDLLLIDETNPRSVGFQLAELAKHVDRLPRDRSTPVLSGEQRAVMAATSLLRLADVTELVTIDASGNRPQLVQLLARLEGQLRTLWESLTHHYLVHAAPRRSLGDMLAIDIKQEAES
jgi:uncharacterized circularly permuted ATP-grasp superfamily protein/uncharacterized alpha-E superfamily protein